MPPANTKRYPRIQALDVLRGLAVFGILVVNVEQMFLPMAYANDPVAVIPGERWAMLTWFLTDAFFEGKFITLFSLLFGAGFALQWGRAAEGGRGFVARYLRRLGLLAVFGLVHAAFFYAADVLVLYGLIALFLLLFRHAKPRTLALTGGVLVALMVPWGMVLSGPEKPGHAAWQRQLVAQVAEIREQGARSLPEAEPEEALVEVVAYSQGPVGDAIALRLAFLARLLGLYTPVYLGWRTLGLFLIGAALAKAGRLDEGGTAFWRRAVWIGLGVGLPLTLAASTLTLLAHESQGQQVYVGHGLHELSSLLLAAGIAGVVFLACAEGRLGRAQRWLAAVGRTALTNYVGQSVVMSLLATSYGLGLFGGLTRLELLGLALGCFVGQVMLSVLWLRFFAMGPLEWLWRCFTWWRRPLPSLLASRLDVG